MLFADRRGAGRQLALQLQSYIKEEPLVLALPRGGVPVAYEIATALSAPLDIWNVRKIGAPQQPELGIGAVAEGGAIVLDRHLIRRLGLSQSIVETLLKRAQDELAQRVQRLRGDHAPPQVQGRTVIVVDDGIATGSTMRAAIQTLKQLTVRRLVIAIPVAALHTIDDLQDDVDAIVCLNMPQHMDAIGPWYKNFDQVSDEEVAELLAYARASEQIRLGGGSGFRDRDNPDGHLAGLH